MGTNEGGVKVLVASSLRSRENHEAALVMHKTGLSLGTAFPWINTDEGSYYWQDIYYILVGHKYGMDK